jgi:hypothetical protein
MSSSTRSKNWVTEPDQAIDIDLSNKTDNDYGKKTPVTIIECLKKSVEAFGSRVAMAVKKSSEVIKIINEI